MTEPEDIRCERCHRPLKDTDSRTRRYGPVCADIVLGVDTHRTPVPRAEHPADPNQIPLPLEDTVDAETAHNLVDRLVDTDPLKLRDALFAVISKLEALDGRSAETDGMLDEIRGALESSLT